jgi:hypothetical protein
MLCQRGKGHPGPCEVMLRGGARITWATAPEISWVITQEERAPS